LNGGRKEVREDTRFRVMRLLNDNPHMSQRDLADAVGISVGSAHYVLSALLEAGLIKFGDFGAASDRRRYAYFVTPKGLSQMAASAAQFMARKLDEYVALRDEIAELSLEFGLEAEIPRDARELREALERRGA
jgi:EPS-associated MarR family transcriptional regulator